MSPVHVEIDPSRVDRIEHDVHMIFKEEVIKRYWGRYLDILELLPPPAFSYQNWIVGRAR